MLVLVDFVCFFGFVVRSGGLGFDLAFGLCEYTFCGLIVCYFDYFDGFWFWLDCWATWFWVWFWYFGLGVGWFRLIGFCMVTKLLVLCVDCNFVVFDSSAWYVGCLLICCFGFRLVLWCFGFFGGVFLILVFSFLGLLDLLVFCSVCLVVSVEWLPWFDGVWLFYGLVLWLFVCVFCLVGLYLGIWYKVFVYCLFLVLELWLRFLLLLLLYILHYLIVILLV